MRCSRLFRLVVCIVVALLVPVATPQAAAPQVGRLVAADRQHGDLFGEALAVSADGAFAFVGARSRNLVYVYTRQGAGWAQTAQIAPSDGAKSDDFGATLALSADGKTVVVGATRKKAAYVFTRNGMDWTQTKLMPMERLPPHFAQSVAISGDGGAVLVSGEGEMFLFTRGDAGWSETVTLTPMDDTLQYFDSQTVALSADGGTALIGVQGATGGYLFTRDAGWAQTKLAVDVRDGSFDDLRVALTADGKTAVIADDGGLDVSGAAYVFTRDGANWNRTAKLAAGDSNARDAFGNAVTIAADGSTILIGAYGNEAAYLFARDGANFTQRAKLLPLDASNDEQEFGVTVALSANGGMALVGAGGRDDDTGVAFLFARTGASWEDGSRAASLQPMQPALTLPDGQQNDGLGSAMALGSDGKTAIIGVNQREFAQLFTRDNAGWHLLTTLTAQDAQANAAFGYAVALSADGMTALVSAPNRNTVYVFTRGATGWLQAAKLTMPEAQPQPFAFGGSVAVSGDGGTILILGLAFAPMSVARATGTVYVFDRTLSGWSQTAQLTAPAPNDMDSFGLGIALSADGKTAVAGAQSATPGQGQGALTGAGAAYLYHRDSTGWSAATPLVPADPAKGDFFGASVALSADGSLVAVGANGKYNSGAAYLFRRDGARWGELLEVTAIPGDIADFGRSLALNADGTTLLVGADRRNSAYVFRQSGEGWGRAETLSVPGSMDNDRIGSTIALSGDGGTALLGAPRLRDTVGAVYPFSLSLAAISP